MNRLLLCCVVGIALLLPLTGWAASQTWNDSSGNHLWANSANWSGSAVPGSGDIAVFDQTMVGTSIVNSSTTVGQINYTNFVGTNYTQILPGQTLSVNGGIYAGYNSQTGAVVVSGGGTLNNLSALQVGYRPNAGNATYGLFTATNITFDTANLSWIDVGHDQNYPGGGASGVCDLSGANIVYGGAPNMLKAPSYLWVGYQPFNGNAVLRLNPALTNIDVGQFYLGYCVGPNVTANVLDLGNNPQLSNMTVRSTFLMGAGNIIYSVNGTSKTGMPPNVSMTLGQPGSPVAAYIGYFYDGYGANSCDVRLGGFSRFESYLSSLLLGENGNTDYQNANGQLDLSSTPILVGSITKTDMIVPAVQLGYHRDQGLLMLPPTITNMACSSLWIGSIYGSAGTSYIDLGTNSALRKLTITNSFTLGRGRFRYATGGGATVYGLPGTDVKIGVSANRATMTLGQISSSPPGTTEFSGITSFEGWLSSLIVAYGYNEDNPSTVTMDLRGASPFFLDVSGTVSLSIRQGGGGSRSYVYLPAGTARAGALTIAPSGDSCIGLLWMSNTVFAITNSVTLGGPLQTYWGPSWAIVSNHICGTSAGIDLQTTNLVIDSTYGKMALSFDRDPVDLISSNYWGFRMASNSVSYLQGLTNSALITYDLSGMSLGMRRRFGIYYNPDDNTTYIGLQRIAAGTVITVR